MRPTKLYSIALWLALIGLGGYYAYMTYARPAPCSAPITYRIGTLDPRFGVATSTFMADIASASGLWSGAIGRPLFKYDPNGAVVINLIYDTRQETTEREQALTSQIRSTSAVADSVKEQYTSLLTSYNAALGRYNADLKSFYAAEDAYSAAVEHWNAEGGAPHKEYMELEAERSDLQAQAGSLEAERQQVNDLGSKVNALIDKYNLLVDHINANVANINNDGLAGTQFEEGVYIEDGSARTINIYQFDNKTYFIRVIAHELGHALGLAHNNNPDSIMNPVNASPSLKLSPDDTQELDAACGIT